MIVIHDIALSVFRVDLLPPAHQNSLLPVLQHRYVVNIAGHGFLLGLCVGLSRS